MLAARRADLLAAQDALAAVGVPAVLNAGGSVFKTAAATQWLTLLEALEQPHRADRVRAAALTDFFGRTAADLEAEPDPTDELSEHVRRLADVFAARGVAAVLESAVRRRADRPGAGPGRRRAHAHRPPPRRRGPAQGGRQERFGVVGLLGWLRTQVADDKIEVASERTRRLDSDAAAVQLVTIHGSKGLEYPVVYLPTLWDRCGARRGRPPLPRHRRRALPRRGRTEPVARRLCRREPPRGRRRVAPAALRRPHPGAVAGRRVVLPDRQQHRLRAAPPHAVRACPGACPRQRRAAGRR